ncbi:MAG: hypothetical protein ACI3XM_04980 [Eubacteriales bacterium]
MISNKRMIAACLCTLLLIPSAASCADAGQNPIQPQDDTKALTDETVSEQSADSLQGAIAKLDGLDFGGYAFRILDRSEEDPNWFTIDVYAESENGDVINDAVYQRNRYLEENLNIRIEEQRVWHPYENTRVSIMAGADDFDILTDGLQQLSTLATEGFLYDIRTMDRLHLEELWWDQDMNNDLSIGGKQFFCTGDISIMDNYGTWCVMFNKDIAASYDLPDIYALVRDGKWTIDVMYDMAKTATKDLDGNGKLDQNDQWGFLTETYNEYGLWASAGERITSKDQDDYPVLSAYSDRSVNVLQRVTEFTQDSAATIIAEKAQGDYTYTNQKFGDGGALFIMAGMWLITKYRGYDINFGIVPTPKYDEAQTRYYNTYSYINCTAYSVPLTCADPTRTGVIMEAMAEISKYTLSPAYYDVALKGKFIRDDESAEMLDLILAHRAYDLGMIFNWGSLFTTITGLATAQSPDFASAYAKQESAAQKDIEQFIEQLNEIE